MCLYVRGDTNMPKCPFVSQGMETSLLLCLRAYTHKAAGWRSQQRRACASAGHHESAIKEEADCGCWREALRRSDWRATGGDSSVCVSPRDGRDQGRGATACWALCLHPSHQPTSPQRPLPVLLFRLFHSLPPLSPLQAHALMTWSPQSLAGRQCCCVCPNSAAGA